MRKVLKSISVAMAVTMLAGMFTGCGKVKEAAFTYNPDDYIKLGNYKGMEIEVSDPDVTDADLQNVIDQLLDKNKTYEVVDRVAREGDEILLNFNATISGIKIEGFSGTDYNIVIGSGDFLIDGFEEALIGLKAGDKRAITGLKVPETFTEEPEYAGRGITFNIDVQSVKEAVLPEYNDEFVTTVSEGNFTTVDAYNEELMKMLKENAESNYQTERNTKILDKLVENVEVINAFPQEYVDSKIENLQKEVVFYTGINNMTEEEYLLKYYDFDNYEDIVNKQIAIEMAFQKIIEQENFEITESYYKKHLQEAADARGFASTAKFIEKYTEDGVVKSMLFDMVTDLLLDTAVEK